MESHAAMLRLVYSSDAAFDRKLNAAQHMLAVLLHADKAGAADDALPPLVRGHYLRSLLDWVCGVLTRKSGPAGSEPGKHKAKKHKVDDEQARRQQLPAQPKLQPQCWAVLQALLASSSISSSQPLPAALLPAATAALEAVQQPGEADQAGELLAQVAALLQLLSGKFKASFRPGIEHAAGAAQAALNGHASARNAAQQHVWASVAAAAVDLLHATAAGHPNQRKVWDATLPRLLPLLAQAAFPATAIPSNNELIRSCTGLLEAVLFNQQHVAALAAAAAVEMSAACVDDGTAAAEDEGQNAGQNTRASYAGQLFAAVSQQIADGKIPYALLPWMVGQFCAALRQHRQAENTEAAITGQAGLRSAHQPPAVEAREEGGGQQRSQPLTGGSLSMSADFHFWVALTRTVLPLVENLQQQGDQLEQLASAMRGVALLAGALQEQQLYRPTQDPGGQQRALLQRLADTALQLGQSEQQAGVGASLLQASLAVLGGILAVEHRAIQQHLPALWPLLLRSSAAPAAPSSGGRAAIHVACSLVGAFAELRQLEVLLGFLTSALSQLPEGDTAEAAVAVVGSNQFQAALAAAVRQLPSGQVPMVLRLAVQSLPALFSSGASGALCQLAADLYCCCLSSLQVDLTTAVAAADAARALVHAISPALARQLEAAGGGGSSKDKEKKRKKLRQEQEALLPALLQLYRHTLAVHARCAALHPEVMPLPDQHAQLADSQQDMPTQGCLRGYFAPLVHSMGLKNSMVSQLQDLVQASRGTSSLQTALVHAAVQRAGVLHQQWQHLTHTCPVALMPSLEEQGDQQTGLQPAADTDEPQEQAKQQRWREQVESELHMLTSFIAAAAAEEAGGATSAPDNEAYTGLAAVLEALHIVQQWAAEAQLQALLQACLRSFAASPGGASERQRGLCCSLLLHSELLEQHRLVALLPAAAAAELSNAFSTSVPVAATDGEGVSSPATTRQKKRKKAAGKDVAVVESDTAGLLSPALEQLARLAKRKEVKAKAWATAVETSCSRINHLAVGAAGSAGSKQTNENGWGGAANSGVLEDVHGMMALLAQLPLGWLPAGPAAGMTAVTAASLLCCCETSLAGQAAAVPAVISCLTVLASLAEGASTTGVGLNSQLALLPRILQAALLAAYNLSCLEKAGSPGAQHQGQQQQLEGAAQAVRRVMQSVCAATLECGDAGSLDQALDQLSLQLSSGQKQAQWAASVLVEACLAAVHAALRGHSGRAVDILCARGCTAERPQPAALPPQLGSHLIRLDAAVAAALPPAAAAAGGDAVASALAASLFSSAAILLRLRCCDHPVACELDQQTGTGCFPGMAECLQLAVGLLAAPSAPDQGPLTRSLLQYVAAACYLAGRMRPAASTAHYASLLALLVHLLGARQLQGTADAASISPFRHAVPFAASFPTAGTEGAMRALVLEALQELLAGSSSQQLLIPLRFVEASLPATSNRAAAALPSYELLLAVLEAGSSGSRQQRLLGQHSERIAALLTASISAMAYGSGTLAKQQLEHQPPSPQQLVTAILAAAEGRGSSAAPAADTESAGVLAVHPTPTAAEVAALCTALRALESLAARPKLFPLSPAAASSILSAAVAVWTAYAEQPLLQQQLANVSSAALPGFRFRLGTSAGAGLFAASCHLLIAMLRHRVQEIKRCLPLVLQAVQALLRFLAAAELSAKLQAAVLPRLPGQAVAACDAVQLRREHGWRVKCGELLAAVLAELAGLKEAGIGRYCPHLLASYILLAAAPPSARSRSLLHLSSLAAAAAAGAQGAAVDVAAAAAAEEDVLAGEPLSPEVAAALRQGAYALYGACSAAETQYLYASLGSAAAGSSHPGSGAGTASSWRAALAALKADYETSGRYTGKV